MEETITIHNTLPIGFKLLWYEIVALLGQGAFGVTYLAFDTNLQRKVAIKEYMPLEFASRNPADRTIHPLTIKHEEIYKWGLDRFMIEARTLARFKHPNIVKVYTVFEQNNTAYMVMEYEQGKDLSQLFSRGELTSESELLEIIVPLLEGLKMMHEAHFIHRDIKPANIYIRDNGSPVLIDFGSARQALGNKTRALTTLVSPGFAPYEQYYQSEEHQGPWTDIYALGATVYLAINGEHPTDALVRGRSLLVDEPDPLTPAVVVGAGRYSYHFLASIDCALRFKESDRPQSAEEFRQMLLGEIDVTSDAEIEEKRTEEWEPQLSTVEKTVPIPAMRVEKPEHTWEYGAFEKTTFRPKTLLFAGTILGVIAAASAGIYVFLNPDTFRETSQRIGSQESSTTADIKPDKQERRGSEHQQKLKSLVAQADESMGKVNWRFTLEIYRKALAIDPENQPAKRGMMRLAYHQVTLAEKAITKGNLPQAKEHLIAASSIIPDSVEVKKLEKKIAELEINREAELAKKQRQAAAQAKRKQDEVRNLQLTLFHAKASLDKAKSDADHSDARTRAITAYRSAENLASQAMQLMLDGTELIKKHNYVDAKNTFNRALGLFTEAIESYTAARDKADSQIRKERIDRQQSEIKTAETALEKARRNMKKTMVKADSIEAMSHAQDIYKQAQRDNKQAEDLASRALRYKTSANYSEALKAFNAAVALFNRASTSFEEAHILAKKKIDEISQQEPLTKEDLEFVRTRLLEFKKAYEHRDLEKLQQISTMSATRLSILRLIFSQYRALEVSISNFAMITGQNSASATVTITNLITQSGDQVIPSAHWREANISLHKESGEWGKINW